MTEGRLGPYRLMGQVGEGGMSVVHLGLDPAGRTVAVKVLKPHVAADAEGRSRFVREVRAMRRVRGRHVAEVLDAAVEAATPYLVTEYVAGRPLDEVVREDGPLDVPALGRLGAGLADALLDIHEAGLVHRDLKPGNVLLVDGDPTVIDFGIARLADDARVTSTGLLVGTPAYLAPEVVRGDAPTPAVDVHGWGATMAFAATGRPAFGRGSLHAVLWNVSGGRADLEGLPAGLLPLVSAALSPRPEERPSPAELRAGCTRLHAPFARSRAATAPATAPATVVMPAASAAAAGAVVAGIAGAPAHVPPGTRPTASSDEETARLAPTAPTARRSGAADPGDAPRASAGQEPDPTRRLAEVPGTASDRAPAPPWVPDPPPDPPRDPPRSPEAAPTPSPDPWAAALASRQRHRPLAATLLAATAGLAALVPVVAAAVVVTALVVLRTADAAAVAHRDRRGRRGAGRADGALTVVGLPWYALRGAATTLWRGPLILLAGAAVGVVVCVVAETAREGRGWTGAAAATAAVFVALSWAGRRGVALRRASSSALDAVAPSRTAGAVVGLVALVLAVVAAWAAWSGGSIWWPLEAPPAVGDFLPELPPIP